MKYVFFAFDVLSPNHKNPFPEVGKAYPETQTDTAHDQVKKTSVQKCNKIPPPPLHPPPGWTSNSSSAGRSLRMVDARYWSLWKPDASENKSLLKPDASENKSLWTPAASENKRLANFGQGTGNFRVYGTDGIPIPDDPWDGTIDYLVGGSVPGHPTKLDDPFIEEC